MTIVLDLICDLQFFVQKKRRLSSGLLSGVCFSRFQTEYPEQKDAVCNFDFVYLRRQEIKVKAGAEFWDCWSHRVFLS